jgi:hypothetical protein
MNTNNNYTEEQQQVLLHLKDVDSDLKRQLQSKLSEVSDTLRKAESIVSDKLREVEFIFTNIRFNATMIQINLKVPRLEVYNDIQPLSVDQQDEFKILLGQLRTGLSEMVASSISSLPDQDLNAESLRHIECFLRENNRGLPREIRSIECAWRIRLSHATTIDDSRKVFEQIRGEVQDTIRRRRSEFKEYIAQTKVIELKYSVLRQLKRELPTRIEAMELMRVLRYHINDSI